VVEWDTAPWNIYSGYWSNVTDMQDFVSIIPPTKQSFPDSPTTLNDTFTTSTWSLIAITYDENAVSRGLVHQSSLSCAPWRATYTLNIAYQNNCQTMNISTDPLGPLVNFYQLEDEQPGVMVPGLYF